MRTKTILIGNKRHECILLAGAPEFKIYSTLAIDGVLIANRKRLLICKRESAEFKAALNFVNCKYLSLDPIECQKELCSLLEV